MGCSNESYQLAFVAQNSTFSNKLVRLRRKMGYAVKLALFLAVSACIFARIEGIDNNQVLLIM